MKLQRYIPEIDKITRDHCRAAMVETYAEGGCWVRDDDVEALEAENTALHAECDRLTAMLGPQKPMSAKEMTEPGIYALYPHGHKTGGLVVALKSDSGKIFLRDVLGTGGLNLSSIKKGRFIGPIKPPEVSNA